MTVSQQINGVKPTNVEMYVMPFNRIMQAIVIEDAKGKKTEINLTNSQCEVLIEVLQKNLAWMKY